MSEKVRRAYNFLSSVNMEAYKHTYLLSNQVLSKSPYTNNFLKEYVKGSKADNPTIFFILSRLIVYYSFSIRKFFAYLLEFIEYFLSGMRYVYPKNKGELIIIDSFFIVDTIKKNGSYRDTFFPGLADALKKSGKDFVYLPAIDGIKKRLTMWSIFKILLKQDIPILCEYQLLSAVDFARIFYFILSYPFFVLRFAYRHRNGSFENALLKSELIKTLGQVTFPSFSRYLQGKKIARLPYEKIKVISWYENQVIHKNLYKGLRSQGKKVQIYGAQLLIYSKNDIYTVADENEDSLGIIPDKILVNGPMFIPEETKLHYAVGPSMRYAKIFNGSFKKENRKNILVLLPYSGGDIENTLQIIREIDSLSETVFLKAHPSTKIDAFRHLLPRSITIVNEDIYRLFERTKIMIGAASGTLLEATALGIPVISIKNTTQFDYNPLPTFGKGVIWEEVDSPEALRQQISRFESALNAGSSQIDDIAKMYKKSFFCEPTNETIIRSFDL